jgi:hypothetical protein
MDDPIMGYYRNLEPLKGLQQASPYWKNAWPIPADSTGFEDPKVDSGSHEAKY